MIFTVLVRRNNKQQHQQHIFNDRFHTNVTNRKRSHVLYIQFAMHYLWKALILSLFDYQIYKCNIEIITRLSSVCLVTHTYLILLNILIKSCNDFKIKFANLGFILKSNEFDGNTFRILEQCLGRSFAAKLYLYFIITSVLFVLICSRRKRSFSTSICLCMFVILLNLSIWSFSSYMFQVFLQSNRACKISNFTFFCVLRAFIFFLFYKLSLQK
jgi:hypothetical protein